METDHISRLLARDPLMCYYEVVAKDTLPEVVSTYPSAFVCNTHDSDQSGEHWVAMYVDEIGDYFDPHGQKPQHAEFTNFMNKHCMSSSQTYRRQFWRKKSVRTVQLITESIQRIPY